MSLDEYRVPSGETPVLYADVIVPRHIDKVFTYIIPDALAQAVTVGRRVLVPFGRSVLHGAVISLSDRPPAGMNAAYLKEICSLADGGQEAEFLPVRFELLRSIAEHYVAPWGQCLRLVVPRQAGKRVDTAGRKVKPIQSDSDRGQLFGGSASAEPLQEPDHAWIARVTSCLQANQARKLVLHARWEQRVGRLVGAVRQVHAIGKSAIILCGEIARVEWLRRVLAGVVEFPLRVHHTMLEQDWREQAQGGAPTVIVGTRSAIFSPLRSIGLIWLEGEEDPAFKEPQEPRYHAREVAWMRAKTEGALVVLASAHPSMETSCEPGVDMYTVHTESAGQPRMELVDLRHEVGGTLLSKRLVVSMQEAIERRAGILLFLNRKGYARTLICRDCGWIPRCKTCAVALAYSREGNGLACRYCGEGEVLPQSCPLCRATHLHAVGDGTERVEAEVRRLFPQARIARLDGERLRRTAEAHALWEGIQSRTWDIVIGTQAIFQRGPLPRMGLVGILQADSGLHIPDFRAAERTYQLLDEAASVARPASEGGCVVLQTRMPAHHAVQAVLSSDPRRFYEEELAARRLLNYPPASHLAALSVSGKDAGMVESAAQQWKNRLEESLRGKESVAVLGPVPAMGKRPKGHTRHQILAKGTDRTLLSRRIRESVEQMERDYRKGRIRFIVDMDPIDMG